MKQVNEILHHPLYQEALKTIEEAEKERIFCKHDMNHFLAVARLAYIDSLEQGIAIPKAIIYSAALLHDMGRALEYTQKIPHHQAGVSLAEKILPQCGFSQEEQRLIKDAILFHRKDSGAGNKSLRTLLYKADKASRACFVCKAQNGCKWPAADRNLEIDV